MTLQQPTGNSLQIKVVSKLILEVILRVIFDCLNPFPERRPSASEIDQTFEDIHMSGKRNESGLVTIETEFLASLLSQADSLPFRAASGPSGSSTGEISD